MHDTLTHSAAELAEMFARELPCGGVAYLNIPPCGRSATWTMAYSHGCGGNASPHKCDLCMTLFLDSLGAAIERRGYLICTYCDRHFHAIDDFVRYRKV